MKIDETQPIILENGCVQLRMAALMFHPDYDLDTAYGGRYPRATNRNAELESWPTATIIQDAKTRMEEAIERGDYRICEYFLYAQYMSDQYDRAVSQGLIDDPTHDRRYYIQDGTFFSGRDALHRQRHGIVR